WGTLTKWDELFKEKTRNSSLQDTRLCLIKELEVLKEKFELHTTQGRKVVAFLRTLEKKKISELHVNVGEFSALIKYCQDLKEMQENHIDEISQLGRHLSILLKWSDIDSKLFEIPVTPPTILRPALHLNNLKIQMWSKILSDSFVLNQTRFKPIWELNHLIPGNAKEGSSRSYFVAAILNSKQWQFPFFIVEFEQHGFEVHKDFAIVICEAVFELDTFWTH
ncbi:5615_t:CDS:2, partial [Diversispora eburnea]